MDIVSGTVESNGKTEQMYSDSSNDSNSAEKDRMGRRERLFWI